jgi:hypothetical protein
MGKTRNRITRCQRAHVLQVQGAKSAMPQRTGVSFGCGSEVRQLTKALGEGSTDRGGVDLVVAVGERSRQDGRASGACDADSCAGLVYEGDAEASSCHDLTDRQEASVYLGDVQNVFKATMP